MVIPPDLLPYYLGFLAGVIVTLFPLCARAEYQSWKRKNATPQAGNGGGTGQPGSAGNSRG